MKPCSCTTSRGAGTTAAVRSSLLYTCTSLCPTQIAQPARAVDRHAVDRFGGSRAAQQHGEGSRTSMYVNRECSTRRCARRGAAAATPPPQFGFERPPLPCPLSRAGHSGGREAGGPAEDQPVQPAQHAAARAGGAAGGQAGACGQGPRQGRVCMRPAPQQHTTCSTWHLQQRSSEEPYASLPLCSRMLRTWRRRAMRCAHAPSCQLQPSSRAAARLHGCHSCAMGADAHTCASCSR